MQTHFTVCKHTNIYTEVQADACTFVRDVPMQYGKNKLFESIERTHTATIQQTHTCPAHAQHNTHAVLTLFTVLATVTNRAVAAVGVPLADTHSTVLTHIRCAVVFLRWATWSIKTLNRELFVCVKNALLKGAIFVCYVYL